MTQEERDTLRAKLSAERLNARERFIRSEHDAKRLWEFDNASSGYIKYSRQPHPSAPTHTAEKNVPRVTRRPCVNTDKSTMQYPTTRPVQQLAKVQETKRPCGNIENTTLPRRQGDFLSTTTIASMQSPERKPEQSVHPTYQKMIKLEPENIKPPKETAFARLRAKMMESGTSPKKVTITNSTLLKLIPKNKKL